MKLAKHVYHRVNETVYTGMLQSGLTVKIVPKQGFAKKSVAFVVKFGSVHKRFVDANQTVVTMKEGIHHFIEHMLFESGADDLSRKFMAANAMVNAYTTTNRTVYFFHTTAGIDKPLGLLVDMLFHPKFEIGDITKEQAIIEQEYRMYEDDVDQAVYFDTLASLYHTHPVKDEVLGTVSSIRSMDQSIIEQGLQIGYHPANMTLLIVGDVDPEAVFEALQSMPELNRIPTHPQFTALSEHDIDTIVRPFYEVKKDINIAYVTLAAKVPNHHLIDPMDCAILEIKLNFFLETLIGKQSDDYHQLIKRQLANDSLDYSSAIEVTNGYFRITTESKKPEQTLAALQAIVQNAPNRPLDETQFLANRNRLIGSYYRAFNRIDGIANVFSEYLVKGIDVDRLMDQALKLQVGDLAEIAQIVASSPFVSLIHRP
jgi:predicted Zn-dependent peptidase